MNIWFKDYSIDEINERNKNTMVDNCEISIISLEENALVGEMKVTSKIKQPFGIVHGGANCVLAETLGSIATNLTCDPDKAHGVGLSITTNHIRAVRNGVIKGVATPIHIGRSTQVWEVKTYNDAEQLTSSTKLTMSIITRLGK